MLTAKEEIDKKDQRMTQGKCLIHEDGKHSTEQCKVYSLKSIDDKKTLLKEKNACWSCLKVGHRSRVCRAKRICNKRLSTDTSSVSARGKTDAKHV